MFAKFLSLLVQVSFVRMLTSICNFGNWYILFIGHETQYREYYKTGKDAGPAVDDADNDGVLVAIVFEFVVTGHGNQTSRARTEWVKNLRTGITPHTGFQEFVEVRLQVVDNPVDGPWECDPPEHQNDQHQVRENSGKVHHLSMIIE